MNTSIKMNIPTSIGSCSTISVYEVFPRGHGNYITTINSEGEKFAIVNLSCEDLEDAINLGLIDDEMEADVYLVAEENYSEHEKIRYVAFITDKRLPEKCLTPEWWYHGAHNFSTEILKKKYNILDTECLCENKELHRHTIFWGSLDYQNNLKKGKCRQCNKQFESFIKNN